MNKEAKKIIERNKEQANKPNALTQTSKTTKKDEESRSNEK